MSQDTPEKPKFDRGEPVVVIWREGPHSYLRKLGRIALHSTPEGFLSRSLKCQYLIHFLNEEDMQNNGIFNQWQLEKPTEIERLLYFE